MELSEAQAQFDALGISVAAITHDSVATNKKFSDQYGIRFPLLSDGKAVHTRAFGILNENYSPGDRAYGTPHPGIFLINAEGVIHGKFAEDGYRKRPALGLILEAATEMVRNSAN